MTGHGASWSSRAGDESSTSSRGSGHADDDSGDGFDTAHDSRYPADVYSDAADSADDDDGGGGGGSINTPAAVQTSPSQSRLLGEHHGTIKALLCDYNTRHRTRFTTGQEYMCHYDKRTGVYTLPLHGASGATYGALIAHIASAYGETCVDIGTETSASGTTTTFLYVNIVKGPSGGGGGAHQTAPYGNRRRRGVCGAICYALAIMVAICTVAAAADYLAPERPHGNAVASWRVASRASVAIAMASASAARKMGQMAFDALVESPAVPPAELHRDAAAAAADALPPPPPSKPQTDTQTDTSNLPPRQAHSPAAPVAPPDERHSLGYRLFSAVVSGVFGDALERRSGGGGAASDGVYLDYGSSDDDSAGGGGGGGGDGDPRQAPEKRTARL